MIKKYKKVIIGLLIAWILFCLAYGGMLWREMRIFNAAEELRSRGEYAAAKAEFERIGETEKMAQCDEALQLEYLTGQLESAKAMLEKGDIEQAKAQFVILGDFGNAAELVVECDYRRAEEMFRQGQYSDALTLLNRLEDEHEKAPALLEQTREAIYSGAVEAAYECRLEEAMADFALLGDYKDSGIFYRRCSDRIINLLSDWEEPVNYADYAGMKLAEGTLYWHRIGLVYVPYETGPETTGMIFYPGGYDQSLANGYMTDYIYGYYGALPNSIMVFCYANG